MLLLRVIVIGAGIVGASAAYHLSRENNEVTLIDASHQGQATAAGAGIICPWTSLERGEDWYNIANEAAHFYPNFIEQLKEQGEENVSYKKVGSLVTALDEAQLQTHLQLLEERRENAPLMGNVEKLSPDKARELFPPLDEKLHALHIPGAARVDGGLLTKALLRLAKDNGVNHVQGEANLVVENNQVHSVKVKEAIYEADKILVTAGAWAKELLRPLNLTLNIEPQRGQIIHLQLPESNTGDWPVISPVGSGHYIVSFDDSRAVIGATRETNSGYDYRMTAGGVAEVLNEGLKVAPGLAKGTVADIRIGFRPMGTDLLPLIGQIEQVENLYIANGLGPSGLTIGPYVGKLVSQMILEKSVEIDLAPYHPKRAIF